MSSTRGRLVRIAADLLEEGGTAAVTFREIGKRAGLSHNAAHKLFGGKEELLVAIAADGLEQLRRTLTRDDNKGPAESIRALLNALVTQALARPRLFELTYSEWTTSPLGLDTVALAGRRQLDAEVTRGQEAGQLPPGDPERMTSLLLAVAQGAARLELLGHLNLHDNPEQLTATDLVDDLVDLLSSTTQQRL